MAEKFNRPNKSNEFEIQVTSEKNIFSTWNVWVSALQKTETQAKPTRKIFWFFNANLVYCKHKITIALRHDFIYSLRQNEDMWTK